MKRLLTNLTFWVLTAITIGILLGHYAPEIALKQVMASDWKAHFLGQELKVGKTLSEFFGGLFISVVKLFINPIIFLTITLGIVSMGDLKKVGKIGAKALLYFEVVTTIALIIGIVVAHLIRPGDGVDGASGSAQDMSTYTTKGQSFDWCKFFMDKSTLQVLILALVLGVVFSKIKNNQQIIHWLNIGSKYVFKGLHRVMLFAPVGAFGGMAYTIGKFGLSALFL